MISIKLHMDMRQDVFIAQYTSHALAEVGISGIMLKDWSAAIANIVQ